MMIYISSGLNESSSINRQTKTVSEYKTTILRKQLEYFKIIFILSCCDNNTCIVRLYGRRRSFEAIKIMRMQLSSTTAFGNS